MQIKTGNVYRDFAKELFVVTGTSESSVDKFLTDVALVGVDTGRSRVERSSEVDRWYIVRRG